MNMEKTVYQYIKKAIIENRLPPGTRLRELQLAEIFSVKRGLIRKVLTKMTSSKLIEHIPNVGAQVACPSIKDGQDLFATRCILEKAVIQHLIQHITNQQIAELRDYLKKEENAYRQGNIQLGVRLSADFHKQLAQLTGNLILEEFLTEIINRTPLVMMQQTGNSTQQGCINHEHKDIVDALEQKDLERALDMMKEHLQHLENMFSVNNTQPSTDLAEIFQLQPS